ncbi:MAG: tetratricopeptide repeat protein [Akkermansia sp.]
MNFPIFGIACLLSLIPCAPRAWAQSPNTQVINPVGADPSDIYLMSWNILDQGEKAATKKDYITAIKKVQESEQLLQAISKDRPDWKPGMVSFRRQKNADLMRKWQSLAQQQATSRPVANLPSVEKPSPATPGSKSTPESVTEPSPNPHKNIPSPPSFDSMQKKYPRQDILPPPPAPIDSIPRPRPVYAPTVISEQGESSYDRLNRDLMRSQMENKALVKALQQTRVELEEALVRRVSAESGESAYKQQLNQLRAQIERERGTSNELLVNLTRQLNKAENALKTAEEEKQRVDSELAILRQRLKENEQQLSEVSNERNQLKDERNTLKAERDHLATILELNSPEKTKNLLDRNLTLAAQLKEAQTKIGKLETLCQENNDQKAVNLQELERTRNEVTSIKLSLSSLMDENVGYRRRITELNNQLTNSEAELAKQANEPKADPIAIEENKLLRSTVTKQLRLLSTQVKSRELMMAAYERLKLKDPSMVEAIHLLSNKNNIQLTPEEQKIATALAKQQGQDFSAEREHSQQLAINEQSVREQAEKAVRSKLESEALGNAASASFEKGRYAAAEQLYKTLLDSQPDHFPARVNMGTILLKRNLVNEAITHLTRAIQITPESAPANFLLGIAYYRAGQDKQAIVYFTETVKIQPDNMQAYIYMGNIESSSGNADQAVKYYDKALKIKPELPDVLFNKATTLARANKIKEAKLAYDLAIQSGALPDLALQQTLDPTSQTTPQIVATANDVQDQKQSQEQSQPTPGAQQSPPSTSVASSAKAPLTPPVATTPAPQSPIAVVQKAPIKENTPSQPIKSPPIATPATPATPPQPKLSPKEDPSPKEDLPTSRRRFRIG